MSVFFEFAPPQQAVGLAMTLPKSANPAVFEGEFDIQQDQIQHVQFGPNNAAISLVTAYTLRKGSDLASADWQIRIEPFGFSVHCLNYSRWHHVWPETRSYLARLLSSVERDSVVTTVGLRYVDQFFFNGRPEDYDASLLLKKGPHIHPKAFTSGTRWHCHTGWFESHAGSGEVLNQLNIGSVVPVEGTPGPEKIMIVIDHGQLKRAASGSDLSRYLQPLEAPTIATDLDQLMQQLHDSNRTVMNDLIQPTVGKQINLQKGPRS